MDEINQSDIEQARAWLAARTQVQQSINRIKMMLWARDYGRAQQELGQLKNDVNGFYGSSLNLKASMTSAYRDRKSELEKEYRQQGLEGRALEYCVQEKIAEITCLQDPVEDSLYLLGPIANIVQKLTEQLHNVSQTPLPEHANSGFRYDLASMGAFCWEMRAYRPQSLPIQPGIVLKSISQEMRNLFPIGETDTDHWPLWFRTFPEAAYLEYKFYDAKRFTVTGIGHDDTQIKKLLMSTLDIIGGLIRTG